MFLIVAIFAMGSWMLPLRQLLMSRIEGSFNVNLKT